MIDVSRTYPNTFHQCLLHYLYKQKFDGKVVELVALLFWTNCQTVAKINENTKTKLSINLGLS